MLLLIGSTLSCLLVPWISENSSHRRVLQEQRVSEARDILKQSLADDAQLNAIVTSIEMFNKDPSENNISSSISMRGGGVMICPCKADFLSCRPKAKARSRT